MSFQHLLPIKRVLISVSNKEGLESFARFLWQQGVELLTTGSTGAFLTKHDIPNTNISEITQFPEMMDGRVKTLHPMIHGGILGLRDKHEPEATQHQIKWIDMVVCNFYPFKETIEALGENATTEEIIEQIDVGGPTMIRSAAKNIGWVVSVCDPADYQMLKAELLAHQSVKLSTRQQLSLKAFTYTARYDAMISNYFLNQYSNSHLPTNLVSGYSELHEVRYGENPHQLASIYVPDVPKTQEINWKTIRSLRGKEISFNNYLDMDAALNCLREFKQAAVVIVKHNSPCGVATGNTIEEAFDRAFQADSLSAFGGVVALNKPLTPTLAEKMNHIFIEVVVAPYFLENSPEIFTSKNLRLVQIDLSQTSPCRWTGKFIDGALLYQEKDFYLPTKDTLKTVTHLSPSPSQIDDLLFAWAVAKHSKSNAIVIANYQQTVGIGSGHVSRVDAVHTALRKTNEYMSFNDLITDNCSLVLASDAFFPFRDSIDLLVDSNIKAIIQPGGSINDAEVIEACNQLGISMVFTGRRGFRH